jgi:hypothetical protein
MQQKVSTELTTGNFIVRFLLVISVLEETQTQTVSIMKSIENNIIKIMASKDYDRIISIINVYKELTN